MRVCVGQSMSQTDEKRKIKRRECKGLACLPLQDVNRQEEEKR